MYNYTHIPLYNAICGNQYWIEERINAKDKAIVNAKQEEFAFNAAWRTAQEHINSIERRLKRHNLWKPIEWQLYNCKVYLDLLR